MKSPDFLIITNTETAEGIAVSKDAIIQLHTRSRAQGGLGFNRPGFDYLVTLSGKLETIIQEENLSDIDLWGINEGVAGVNGLAKVIAYAGGRTEKAVKEKDTRTDLQKETLEAVVKFYVKRFPKIRVLGWDQIPSKKGSKSPAFDVPTWLSEIGIPSENRFQA